MRLDIGDIQIDVINDGQILADTGGAFGLVPRVLWARHYEADEQSRVPFHHNCLLVRTAGKTILVDTGQGTRLPEKVQRIMALTRPEGDLVAGLARLGVKPADVDIVVNTHLHSDHCGGNTVFDEDGQVVATYPNAEYVVQRLEYAAAAFPNERTRATYLAPNFRPLYRSGQLRLLDGDTEIVPGMRAVVTPGHTPAHMSIVFEDGGESALYVADLATLAVHLTNLAWMTAYDEEPLVTLETKRRWQRWLLERDGIVLFEHDPYTVAGRLAERSGGLSIESLDAETGGQPRVDVTAPSTEQTPGSPAR